MLRLTSSGVMSSCSVGQSVGVAVDVIGCDVIMQCWPECGCCG